MDAGSQAAIYFQGCLSAIQAAMSTMPGPRAEQTELTGAQS